ncbi:unnamed protein product, partial [Soboliphyme baturini]|uniref:Complex I-SGDH n=1 Tax=Soboliphyme baturini TaxID=241478 RepID=A0A183J010_9BILA
KQITALRFALAREHDRILHPFWNHYAGTCRTCSAQVSGLLAFSRRIPPKFFRNSVGHYELWPLFFAMGAFFAGTAVIVPYTLSKFDVWLNRSNPIPPWDWRRCRDKYMNIPTRLYRGNELRRHLDDAALIVRMEDQLYSLYNANDKNK